MTNRNITAMWFGEVGIVRVANPAGQFAQYYIGKCIKGNTEDQDIQHISDWGSKFPSDAGDVLFRATPFLMYEDKTFYGDKKSLDFIWKLIRDKDMNSHRRSAEIK